MKISKAPWKSPLAASEWARAKNSAIQWARSLGDCQERTTCGTKRVRVLKRAVMATMVGEWKCLRAGFIHAWETNSERVRERKRALCFRLREAEKWGTSTAVERKKVELTEGRRKVQEERGGGGEGSGRWR